MSEKPWSAQYSPGTVKEIRAADRAYFRTWTVAVRDFSHTDDLRAAMDVYNEHMGYASAQWKQTVKEAILGQDIF